MAAHRASAHALHPGRFCRFPVSLLLLLMATAQSPAVGDVDIEPARSTASLSQSSSVEHLAAVVDSLFESGRYVPADSLAGEMLKVAQSLYGPRDPRLGAWLLRAGLGRLNVAQHSDAESLLKSVLEVQFGPGPEEQENILRALQGLCQTYLNVSVLGEAAGWCARCVTFADSLYGSGDARTTFDLCLMADLHIRSDQLDEAAAILERAQFMVETQLGPNHRSLVEILLRLGGIANARGEFGKAIPLLERSLAIQSELVDRDHPDITAPLMELAVAHRHLGDFTRAAELNRRVLAILEKTYGMADPQVSTVLNNLGIVLYLQCNYTAARDVYDRCLQIRMTVYGERSRPVAVTLINLAGLLADMGRYSETLQLRRRALDILEETAGPEHSLTAYALNSLAWSLRRRGSAREAELLFRRALEITEKIYGYPHHEGAVRRRQVGLCLMDQSRFNEARPYLEAAVAEAREVHGAGHYEVARQERELAELFLQEGNPAKAGEAFRSSLAVLEQQYGPASLYTLPCLEGLARVNLRQGRLDSARVYADGCLTAAAGATTVGSIDLVRAQRLSALVDAAGGSWEAALAQSMQASEMALAIQEDIFQVSSEHEALAYADLSRRCAGDLVGALHGIRSLSDPMLDDVFAMVMRTHGQVLDRMAERRRFAELATDTSGVGRLHHRFLVAAQCLANLIVRGPRGTQENHEKAVAAARRDKENAERELMTMSESFRQCTTENTEQARRNSAGLAAAMEPGSYLIHYARFPDLCTAKEELLHSRQHVSEEEPLKQRYGAFRLNIESSGSSKLEFVDLGDATAVDSLISRYRRSVESVAAGRRPTARQEAEYRDAAQELYDRIWMPLMPEGIPSSSQGHTAPRVHIVMTDQLHMVDFNTLLSPADELLIERWRLHFLSSAGDLLRPVGKRPAASDWVLLAVGNPDLSPLHPVETSLEAGIEHRSYDIFCANPFGSSQPLPGAEEEARDIAGLYEEAGGKVTLLLGEDATETEVKRHLANCRQIHLATHGFFCSSRLGGASHADVAANPLLMSGLLLSPTPGVDDGLLTAQEIVAYDLRHVDCVMLSACTSGLGQLLPGEGLGGLRRAFEMAGAGTVIMALWRIDDIAMGQMMKQAYRHRLAGHAFADAVRLAQLERLRDQRNRLKRIHPASWGGIVVEGDWH